MHPVVVALLHTPIAAPAIILYLAEKFVTLHHPCAARLVVLQAYKTPIPEFSSPVGHIFRYYMGMYINY
jgi:hypothetical protein